jgi:hypothetical protein
MFKLEQEVINLEINKFFNSLETQFFQYFHNILMHHLTVIKMSSNGITQLFSL